MTHEDEKEEKMEIWKKIKGNYTKEVQRGEEKSICLSVCLLAICLSLSLYLPGCRNYRVGRGWDLKGFDGNG